MADKGNTLQQGMGQVFAVLAYSSRRGGIDEGLI